jgi:hypothetical protein
LDPHALDGKDATVEPGNVRRKDPGGNGTALTSRQSISAGGLFVGPMD